MPEIFPKKNDETLFSSFIYCVAGRRKHRCKPTRFSEGGVSWIHNFMRSAHPSPHKRSVHRLNPHFFQVAHLQVSCDVSRLTSSSLAPFYVHHPLSFVFFSFFSFFLPLRRLAMACPGNRTTISHIERKFCPRSLRTYSRGNRTPDPSGYKR